MVKEEVVPAIEVHEKRKLMLKEFQRIVHDELPDELLPMRDIQHYIDLIPRASLLIGMKPHMKSVILKSEIKVCAL